MSLIIIFTRALCCNTGVCPQPPVIPSLQTCPNMLYSLKLDLLKVRESRCFLLQGTSNIVSKKHGLYYYPISSFACGTIACMPLHCSMPVVITKPIGEAMYFASVICNHF